MKNKSNKHRFLGSVRAVLQNPVLLCLPVLVALAAPVTVRATESTMPQVEQKEPLTMPPGANARASYVAKWQRRFEAGAQPIGELQSGMFCSRKGDIQWNAKSAELLLPTQIMFARFRGELQKYGYPTPVPKQASLFQEKPDETAKDAPKPADTTLQIGVVISQVLTNLCLKGTASWTGDAYVKLEWQVFAPDQRKVIFRTTTEGVARVHDKPLDGLIALVPVEAFVAATRNLLADPNFALAIQTPYDAAAAAANQVASPTTVTTPAPGTPVSIDNIVADRPGGEIARSMTELRAAVVTVLADGRSGTGFYIGSSGWLLTNHHVVGDAKVVKVRMPTGRELVADVQRVNAIRDVALLKTEPPGVRPMPLRMDEPGIGEDVYALGSPLGDAFNSTLTRGILSGVRVINDQEFLQSDAAILPGSSGGPLLDKSGQVVGITVAGLGAKGMAGMNFFIPLASAVVKLRLQLENRTPKKAN